MAKFDETRMIAPRNLPKTIYKIENYGTPDSGQMYFSFVEPDSDINPDALDVIELNAEDTLSHEAHYYSRNGREIEISHYQLLELICELYKV